MKDFYFGSKIFFLTKVTKMLGNGRLEAMCFDGSKRLCHIRLKDSRRLLIFIIFFYIFVCLNNAAYRRFFKKHIEGF